MKNFTGDSPPNGRVRELWDALAVHFKHHLPVCGPVLFDFCWCLAELERERSELKREGFLVEGHRRQKVKNPRLQAVRELRQAVHKYSRLFSLMQAAPRQDRPELSAGEALLDGNWKPDP